MPGRRRARGSLSILRVCLFPASIILKVGTSSFRLVSPVSDHGGSPMTVSEIRSASSMGARARQPVQCHRHFLRESMSRSGPAGREADEKRPAIFAVLPSEAAVDAYFPAGPRAAP